MSPVNHGQSNEKKEHPPLSDRFEVVVITEEEDQRQSREKKDDLHFPAEIVFMDTSSVKPERTEPPLVSSERAMMDYISLKGIKNPNGAANPMNYFCMY